MKRLLSVLFKKSKPRETLVLGITNSNDNAHYDQMVSLTKSLPKTCKTDYTHKDYFISLLTYAGANDANFLYTLDGSASVYVINHNLNKYPSVTIFDTNNANAQVETQITFNSLNQATLTFSLPFTGEASFN